MLMKAILIDPGTKEIKMIHFDMDWDSEKACEIIRSQSVGFMDASVFNKDKKRIKVNLIVSGDKGSSSYGAFTMPDINMPIFGRAIVIEEECQFKSKDVSFGMVELAMNVEFFDEGLSICPMMN